MPERYLGKTLGKYRVEELIGSGGFAWVYRGYDPTLEIPVALKVLKPQFAGDPTFEERFRREASTAARLRHPNIVKIYEVGRDGDAVYFAMDYLPTGLANKLDTTPFLAEEFVVRVGLDVARALGFAHREGVIHRDIKVDNILFDAHGNAVVADFGIARAVSGYTQQTGTNMVVGTPQYFAPEQARAKPLDGRADIYSLGVSLFRASTGRLPFEGDDWYEIARAHVEDTPPRPRSINPAISPAFERLLLRCLAKHPDDRPATGEQLADELAEVLANPKDGAVGLGSGGYLSPTETPTVTDSPAYGKKLRRAPGQLAKRLGMSAFGLILIAAAAVPIAMWKYGQAAPPPVAPRIPGATVADTLDPRVYDSLRLAATDPIGAVIASQEARDTSRRKPTALGRIRVTTTDGAALSVNGVPVGTSEWSADTLKAGAYTVRARVAAPEGCSTATDSQVVQVSTRGIQNLSVPVRSCGTLVIEVLQNPLPAGLRYFVTGTGIARQGSLPLAGGALVLPTGKYDLRVSADKPCQDYTSDGITIQAQVESSRRFRLLCDRSLDPGRDR